MGAGRAALDSRYDNSKGTPALDGKRSASERKPGLVGEAFPAGSLTPANLPRSWWARNRVNAAEGLQGALRRGRC
jgi:hypothetical protein